RYRLVNRRAPPRVQGRVSIASYSRNVTYGPRWVLDARTNSDWIPLGCTAGKVGAATNQAAEEGYRVVRNGRISARNSAPGVGTSPQDAKKASRNLLSRLALRMSGRLDSNQRPPEPHIGGLTAWNSAKSVRRSHPALYGFHAFHILQGVRPDSRLVPG